MIDATGLDLGAVKVPGDLGKILAGDDTLSTTGIASLTVGSMGRYGLSTQGGTGDLDSVVNWNFAAVPEPSTYVLCAVGATGLAFAVRHTRRRRRRKPAAKKVTIA